MKKYEYNLSFGEFLQENAWLSKSQCIITIDDLEIRFEPENMWNDNRVKFSCKEVSVYLFQDRTIQLGWFNTFEIKKYKNVSEVIKSKSYDKIITTICFLIADYLKFIDSNSNSN